MNINNEESHYSFLGIAPGFFRIIAGSYVSEAYGAFSTLYFSGPLAVITNLDFNTGFNPIFRSQAATSEKDQNTGFARIQPKRLKKIQ